MNITDALAVLAIYGNDKFLSSENDNLLHDARVLVVAHIREVKQHERESAELRALIDANNS